MIYSERTTLCVFWVSLFQNFDSGSNRIARRFARALPLSLLVSSGTSSVMPPTTDALVQLAFERVSVGFFSLSPHPNSHRVSLLFLSFPHRSPVRRLRPPALRFRASLATYREPGQYARALKAKTSDSLDCSRRSDDCCYCCYCCHHRSPILLFFLLRFLRREQQVQ